MNGKNNENKNKLSGDKEITSHKWKEDFAYSVKTPIPNGLVRAPNQECRNVENKVPNFIH